MSKLDNSSGDFESLRTQLPYEVEDKTDGFHFIGTVHVTLRTRTKLLASQRGVKLSMAIDLNGWSVQDHS